MIGANNLALVLDAETRTALSVIRSLSGIGVRCVVVSHIAHPLAGCSKSCFAVRSCPNPSTSPDEFRENILKLIDELEPRVVLPLTDVSVELLLKDESEIQKKTVLPFSSGDIVSKVSDKGSLIELASSLGIRVPKSLRVSKHWVDSEEGRAELARFVYPAVLKPVKTASFVADDAGGAYNKLPVKYLSSERELSVLLSSPEFNPSGKREFLLQQRISGDGIGVFALCRSGKPYAVFCHHRILEKPPSGGVSVLSESIPEERAPIADALKLLEHYSWDGVAMVEFKRDADGLAYLMEINCRFWGSLQLAIDSGRDFPRLLWELFVSEQEPVELPAYHCGQRLRWFYGNLDHFLIRLKQEGIAAGIRMIFCGEMQLFRFFFRTRLEVFRLNDIGPFLCETRVWFESVFRRRS